MAGIDGFHCDVIKLQSQNSEVACFILKIQQFELPSFTVRDTKIGNYAVSLKKVSPLDFQQYNYFKY